MNFEFVRLSAGIADSERRRMTITDGNASYVVLFLNGKIANVKKKTSQEFPNPFMKGTPLTRSEERSIKGSKALREFAESEYLKNQ